MAESGSLRGGLVAGAAAGDTGGRYDGATIALHWATAAIVVLNWGMAQVEEFVPRGPARHTLWSVHIVLGTLLLLVLVARVLWRLGGGRALPAADRGFVHVAAKATHYGLYLLLGAVVGLGLLNAAARGWDFGFVQLPAWAPGDRALARRINGWHDLAANVLVALALVHAGAALLHHYAWHDGVLRRMLPGRNDLD
ncbi:MAG: cytochrome b [Methylobacteriaceae bacterium]|nr:cytochrome b [Methylobacteriaceae bacterium]